MRSENVRTERAAMRSLRPIGISAPRRLVRVLGSPVKERLVAHCFFSPRAAQLSNAQRSYQSNSLR